MSKISQRLIVGFMRCIVREQLGKAYPAILLMADDSMGVAMFTSWSSLKKDPPHIGPHTLLEGNYACISGG